MKGLIFNLIANMAERADSPSDAWDIALSLEQAASPRTRTRELARRDPLALPPLANEAGGWRLS